MTYEQKLFKGLKILGIALMTFLVIVVIACVNEYLWKAKWIDAISEVVSLLMNVGSLFFCIYMWRLYYKDSLQSEAKAEKKRAEILSKYPDAKDWPFFDHKKGRRTIGWLYGCAIAINLIFIAGHLFIW